MIELDVELRPGFPDIAVQRIYDAEFGRGCNPQKAAAAIFERDDYEGAVCGQCSQSSCNCGCVCNENCPCGQCCELIDKPTIQAVHGLGVAAGMVR